MRHCHSHAAAPPRLEGASRRLQRRSRHGEAALSLVEILCIVGILGMVAAIAVPSLIRSRDKAQRAGCIENLKQINSAQQQWVFEKKPAADAKIKKKDLLPYFKSGEFPVCPSGGSYQLGVPDEKPACSLAKEGHQL